MSNAPEPLRISRDELYSAEVEEYLAIRHNMRQDVGEIEEQPLIIRILYSSWFYLSLASGLGAFLAWAAIEPFYDDSRIRADDEFHLVGFLLFPTVAGCIGLFLGAAEGLMCRNLVRAGISAAVGIAVGFLGGIVGLFAAGCLFSITQRVVFNMQPGPQGRPPAFAILILMMGRGAAWAIAAIPAGLGQGLALRDKKVMLNGVIGGVLGGLAGGLLFDPIDLWLTPGDGEASTSRAVGLTLIGLLVGLFVGLVESWTKTAWLLMRRGPLAGKQFVLFRDAIVLGSAPSADVYLFKDPAIEPRHAVIHNRGGRYEIEDCDTPDGTYVNGVPVQKQILKSGDQIVLGKTVLEFVVKERQ